MSAFSMEWYKGNREGQSVLKLNGPFTVSTVSAFQDTVRKDPPPAIIIDLADVAYMDSAALGALLALHVSCRKDGRKYALIGVPERIRTLFRVAGVNSVLTTCGSLAEAENLLRGFAASA